MEDEFITTVKEEKPEVSDDEFSEASLECRLKSNLIYEHVDAAEFVFKYLRPATCQTGILSHPHGSAKFSQGDSCVIAAVFGPTEIRISKELPQRGAVDVLYRPKVTGTSQLASPVMDPVIGERNIENILVSIFETSIYLEEISRLGYNIIIHEFHDDGSLLAACINAVTVALLDGGCSLRHTVAAVTMILTSEMKLIIDPSSRQLEKGYDAKFIYVFSNEMEILYANVHGHVDSKTLNLALSQAQLGATELFEYFYFLITKKSQKYLGMGKSDQENSNEVKVKLEKVKLSDEDELMSES